MSSYGDFCREQRRARQRVRFHWHECPTCKVKYGTGTSVAPGVKCRNCGWQAPGKIGDDVRAADEWDARRQQQGKGRNRGPWQCPYCNMSFGSKVSRGKHVNMKHGAIHAERRVSLKREVLG